MSKSLNRVKAAINAAGLSDNIRETGLAKTAQMAAEQVGCGVDQIGKSIIFQGAKTQDVYLFLTAGGNSVDITRASAIAGEEMIKADATVVRQKTGFAIGGVSPIGHLSPSRTFMDPRLIEFEEIWVAAGTPNHVFSVQPSKLAQIINAQIIEFN
ncbi:MAG: YbaK/EbsC family protein [Rhodobacteraceae bacterium]|jgi:prolyl-tRNA editing enzyme YbaK/EbsC (Cys-tRNA(Pro) deacylase)|nr:YbaK/EbsC family protein [Paracoccaceae bacterium]